MRWQRFIERRFDRQYLFRTGQPPGMVDGYEIEISAIKFSSFPEQGALAINGIHYTWPRLRIIIYPDPALSIHIRTTRYIRIFHMPRIKFLWG